MTYRATIMATSESFMLIMALVEAPNRALVSRSVVEGAMVSYKDDDELRKVLLPSSEEGKSDLLVDALSKAKEYRGTPHFAGFFELSPGDLDALGFKTMADMARHAGLS
jgi:hypothetical protein